MDNELLMKPNLSFCTCGLLMCMQCMYCVYRLDSAESAKTSAVEETVKLRRMLESQDKQVMM